VDVIEWGGSLLSFAHSIFGPGLCPGDWVWATVMAGLVIGLLPVVGAVLIALMRKGTGNTYNPATLTVIGVAGGIFAFLLPWLLMMGVSESFLNVYSGGQGGLDNSAEAASMAQDYCGVVGNQAEFMGGRGTVYDVLFSGKEPALMLLLRIAMLVVLPGLGVLFIWLQARIALRRGPRWPGRLYWGAFVLAVLLSAPVKANTATFLWLGFVPASVLGLMAVLIVGPPSWSVIERRYQQKGDRERQLQQQPPPYEPPRPPPPYVPPAQNQPVRTPPPTRVVGPPEPQPDRAALARLAADPGPLPFGAAAVGGAAGARPRPAPSADGRFRKIRQLGTGGFGTVWLAKDTQLDRTVAVKMAHAPDAETEERMLREARALAAVHHPNCVRVYDIVSEGDSLALIMEYIEGAQLADAVHENGTLNDVAAARLWMTMAGALSAAHARGVLHRDVKPANVIVDPNGFPHLIDFGIARSKGDSSMTATGMMVGTPDFLAPETATGAAATPASDAWQLAATVSFALSGHPPRGVRENAMASLMAAAKAEPLAKLPRHSAHLRLLTASLDADPSRRPTLESVAREMTSWLSRSGQAQEGPVTRIVPSAQVRRP
jgi:eukaryotic-like serine/threonine-protein kinase